MRHELPDFWVHKIYNHLPLAEQASEFLTQRGEWALLKEQCDDGAGITIAICDTGVDQQHLTGDLKGVRNAKDFTGSNYGEYDRHSHGSHTTGHIGARSDGSGMIGLCAKSDLLHSKVLGDDGSGSTRGITLGMQWAADQGAQIINMSLGGGFSQDIEGACRELSQQGILINAAMGNSGLRGDGHPGNSRYTFGITAVDFNKRIAGFSSRSKFAAYCGYGVNVLSCGTFGRYMRMSGTSMACPDFTGMCGLILGYMKKNGLPFPKTMEQWQSILLPGVEDLGAVGTDVEYGAGFINIWKVLAALKPAPPKPPIPTPEGVIGAVVSPTTPYLIGMGGTGSLVMNVDGKEFRSSVRSL